MRGGQDLAVEELAIRNLIARIAQCADEGPVEEFNILYAEDAVWEIHNRERLCGRQTIIEAALQRWKRQVTGPDSNTRHIISTIAVSMLGDDRAKAKSAFQFYANVNETPILVAVGSYQDQFVKRGTWQLAHRLIHAPDLS